MYEWLSKSPSAGPYVHIMRCGSTTLKSAVEQEKIKLGAAQAPEGLRPELGATVERAIDAAFVSGYRTVMLVAAAMALASAISAALLIEGKREKKRAEHAE